VNLGADDSKQLTESLTFKTDLAWSPDGNRMAHISRSTRAYCYSGKMDKNYAKSGIWVMNSDGGDKDLLLSIPYNSTLETQKTAAAIRLSLKSQNTED